MSDVGARAGSAGSAASYSPELSDAARDLLARRAPRASAIPRGPAGAAAPLSFVQQRIWLFEQMNPGTSAYNLPKVVRLSGPLDVPALRAAVETIVARHEVLRAGVAIGDAGEPVQRALPGTRVPLDCHDLGALPSDERERAALEGTRAHANAPFDIERGPLFRAALFRLGADEHLLSITVHHLAFDGWSSGLLLRELSALYGGTILPEPAVQYADYARWQRDGVARGMERELAWWREALAGAPGAIALPIDARRTATRGGVRAARATHTLDARLGAAVVGVARAEGATPFMVCLAAFQLLVARLSGQDDVVVGCPVAGRTRAETEGTIGCFINVLPLRARVVLDASFRALVAAARRTAVGAFDNQALPFERIVEALQPARAPGVTPFAQLLFNYRNWPAALPAMRGLRVDATGRGAPDTTAGHDLTLYVEERPDGALRLDVAYDARLLTPARVEEMLRQYAQLVEQCVARPDAAVGGHSLVTGSARARLPDPAAPLALPWGGAVHEHLSARAASAPHRAAVVGARSTWSYGELEARANRLAHALRDVGVRRGDRVAIYAHRDVVLPLALLGVLKAGGAFVVLDSAYPAARLAACVAAARPRVLLCLTGAGAPASLLLHAAAALPGGCVRLDLADGADAWLATRPATPPGVPVGPDDVAYVAFTSGTTGTPKGVVGRHGSLAAFTPWRAAEFALGADDRVSLLSGLAHDPLHRDVFAPLELGACVVVPAAADVRDPERLRSWVREAAITVANLTPAMGRLLVAGAGDGERLESLRRVFLVGDALAPRDAARLRAVAPRATLVAYYGATETQQALGVHLVTDADLDEATAPPTIPLGRGAPGVQLLVVNDAGAQAGVGEVGEILVRSPALAAGYLDDPSLTAARFVMTPGAADPSDRAYRTGDVGRYLPDGEVAPLGRRDRQVKVRGFRVELADVEAALGAHPAVRECAAVARADADGELAIHGYVVAAPGAEASGAELRRHLQGLVPAYMVPATITPLAALPLTPNGKLDRAALPALAPADAPRDEHVPPRDGVEEALADIWRELLPVERVGVTDDFFAIGGHSLLAVAMVERAGARLGVRPPLDALFRDPTIAGLAAAMRERHGRASSLVTLRDGEAGATPFFFLHGDFNGGGFACRRLPAYFPHRRPLYLLAPHAPGGPVSIEGMADELLALVRGVRPRGPYLLGGHCNGGLVAYEIARRLRADGERVDALVVVDPPHNNGRFAALDAAVRAAGAALRWDEARRADVFVELRDAIVRRRDGLPAGARRGPAFVARLAAGALGEAAARLSGRRGGASAPLEPRAAYIRRAVRSYLPRPYPGRLDVLWARGPHVAFADGHTAGWERSVAQLRVGGFPGGHGDAFTRHFDALARAVSAAVESAAAGVE